MARQRYVQSSCLWNLYRSVDRTMYIDGYLLLAIYVISVSALLVSIYALWTLEEIRQYYANKHNAQKNYNQWQNQPPIKVDKGKGHWD